MKHLPILAALLAITILAACSGGAALPPFAAAFLDGLAPLLLDLLLAAMACAVAYAATWLRAKTGSAYVESATLRLGEAAEHAVRGAAQRFGTEWERILEDGVIDTDELRELSEMAQDEVRGYLGERGIAELERVLGPDALDAMVRTKVESWIAKLRESGAFVEIES
jgi:hypothetical protein